MLAGAVVPSSAWSHHSFAMYDQTVEKTFTGRLTRFVPGGNHAQLIFELVDEHGATVMDESGKPVIWGVETGPAAAIAQQGVTVKSFPLGTILTVTLNPLRDGRNFGALSRGTSIIHCSNEVPSGGCTVETGKSFLGGDR